MKIHHNINTIFNFSEESLKSAKQIKNEIMNEIRLEVETKNSRTIL